MARRKDEPVAVDPVGMGGIMLQHLTVNQGAKIGATQGKAGMA
jgi:hypothetical protein